MIPTLDILKESGFVPDTGDSILATWRLVFDFGNFKLSAVQGENRFLQRVILFSGVMTTPRTISEVFFETRLQMDSREQCWAWIAHHLDQAVDGSVFVPEKPAPWLAVGRASQTLLPWVADQIAYENRPHCYVDREWAKLLFKSLRQTVGSVHADTDVRFQFDGEVLTVRCGEYVLATAGTGNAWPEAYVLNAGQLENLPPRLRRNGVEFAPQGEYLLMAGWKFPRLPAPVQSKLSLIREKFVAPGATEDEATDEVRQFLMGLWPGDWPGRKHIDLDHLGDPGAWLEPMLGEPVDEVLFGEAADRDEETARGLADVYFWDVCETVELPSSFAEDGEVIDDRALFAEDFKGFLAAWRERVIEEIER